MVPTSGCCGRRSTADHHRPARPAAGPQLPRRAGRAARDRVRPTVTGSPIRNAARVIARHETTPRGYYSGVLALLGRDDDGRQTLDAPILIRTAHGGIRVPVGATLVRHSVPGHEVAETHAKVAAVLRALAGQPAPPPAPRLADHPGVARALADRNRALARFWLEPQADRPLPALGGRSALVVDAEDAWTAMLAHQLRRLGVHTHRAPLGRRPRPGGVRPARGRPRARRPPRHRRPPHGRAAGPGRRAADRRPAAARGLPEPPGPHRPARPVGGGAALPAPGHAAAGGRLRHRRAGRLLQHLHRQPGRSGPAGGGGGGGRPAHRRGARAARTDVRLGAVPPGVTALPRRTRRPRRPHGEAPHRRSLPRPRRPTRSALLACPP
jgi:chorismate binding enzyme